MARVEASIVIACTPDVAWAVAGDYANDRLWRREVAAMSYLSEPPVHLGSRPLETAALFGRRLVTESVVTAFEPGRELAFESVRGPYPVRGSRLLVPVPEGTRFTYRLEVARTGWLGRPLDGLMGWLFRRRVLDNLRRLKAVVESAGPTAG